MDETIKCNVCGKKEEPESGWLYSCRDKAGNWFYRCNEHAPGRWKLDVAHLDWLIQLWRKKKEEATKVGDDDMRLMADCYIDAFQTVRVNSGLPLLPEEG